MIIVNTPHNPTGAVFDEHDIERLTALTRDTDIVILSDEVTNTWCSTAKFTTAWRAIRSWRNAA